MSRLNRVIAFLLMVFLSASGLAQVPMPIEEPAPHYLARIEVHTAAELNALLLRTERLFDSGQFNAGRDTPIAFILHGPEALVFLANNYQQNKSLADLAARLSAFKVVDIKVCKTWMGNKGVDASQLLPFIGTVPFAPAEQLRLMSEENYVYF